MIKHVLTTCICLMLAGYATQTPAGEINPEGIVLLGESAGGKWALDGNSYPIQWFAATNVNYAELRTNCWPQYRMHLDLSIDGGATWIRRLGYGLQTPRSSLGGEMTWSPAADYDLLTTNAVLRLVTLKDQPFAGPQTGRPYDIDPTNGIRSRTFCIAGAHIDSPMGSDILCNDTGTEVIFRQVGAGDVVTLHWVTPTANGYLGTYSNIVGGVNTIAFWIPPDVPAAPQMKFCIRGVQHASIIGYSQAFEMTQ